MMGTRMVCLVSDALARGREVFGRIKRGCVTFCGLGSMTLAAAVVTERHWQPDVVEEDDAEDGEVILAPRVDFSSHLLCICGLKKKNNIKFLDYSLS